MPPKIRSADEISSLSPWRTAVLQQFAEGKTTDAAARALGMGLGTLRRHLTQIGYVLQCVSAAAKVHAALDKGMIHPPPAPGPAPELTGGERALLNAVAHHSDQGLIAQAAGLAQAEVTPQLNALLRKTGAKTPAHLVGRAHTWGLLGAPTGRAAASGPTAPGDERS